MNYVETQNLLNIIKSNNDEAITITSNYFKGGVGKSKVIAILSYLLSNVDVKVLLIDEDLQATLTTDLSKTFKIEKPMRNFYEGIKNNNLNQSIVSVTDNIDLIPGTFDMMKFSRYTRSMSFENEATLLKKLIEPLKKDYDLILIDTVPTPGAYTNTAIVASDYVLMPLQAEEESYNNIENYISYLLDLQEQFNPDLDIIGIVPYLVDKDSTTNVYYLNKLYEDYKEMNLVFSNIVKRSNKISTWAKDGITENKGYDKVTLNMYLNILNEMLERIVKLQDKN